MHLFDRDCQVTPLKPGIVETSVSSEWSINTVPNGGYLMALLASALETEADGPVCHLTAGFLNRSVPGPARIRIEAIGASTRFGRFRVILSQGGVDTIQAFAMVRTFDDPDASRRCEALPPKVPDPRSCPAMPEMPGYTLYRNMDVRMDPACCGWMTGQGLTHLSEHRGWIRFREERPLDDRAVLLMADAFPPPIFATEGMVAWVPTLEFSASIRSIPEASRLMAVFRTRFVTGGILEEDGELWDEAGNLVAHSRQISQYRRG